MASIAALMFMTTRDIPNILPCGLLLVIVVLVISSKRKRKVFLIDFACFKPPSSHAVSNKKIVKIITSYCKLSEETVQLMESNVSKGGFGDETSFPRGLLSVPINGSMEESRFEVEWSLFGTIDQLFAKTGVNSSDIGILVVNNTVFCPVPSLLAMIVNKFKLRDNIKSYNLNAMGCSAGLSAIALVKNLLQVHEDTYALIVSTEILSPLGYPGKDHSMILSNIVFRSGAAAILVSNRASDRGAAKYELVHTVQTNTAESDMSYNCIFRKEDDKGIVGVKINKDLIAEAGKSLKTHISVLGHLVLPFSEQLRFAVNHVARHFHVVDVKPYAPDFMKAVNHVISHVGGRPVLDELEKSLKLNKNYMEPSRMTLYRFGNTLSSSVWYGLAYSEAKGRIKNGDRVWQLAFGSGFKCTSLVWKAMKTIQPNKEKINPWSEEIDKFPVDVSNLQPLGNFVSNPID